MFETSVRTERYLFEQKSLFCSKTETCFIGTEITLLFEQNYVCVGTDISLRSMHVSEVSFSTSLITTPLEKLRNFWLSFYDFTLYIT